MRIDGDQLRNVNNTLTGGVSIQVGTLENSGTIATSGGVVATSLMNKGTIRATGFLELGSTQPVTNTGLLGAATGGTLNLHFVTVVNTGTITADGTGVVLIGTVSGGTLAATNGVLVQMVRPGGSLLDGRVSAVIHTATIDIAAGAITGAIENKGVLRPREGVSLSLLQGGGDVTLTGGGRLELLDGLIETGSHTLTNANHTIAGSGRLGVNSIFAVNAVNTGTIIAEGHRLLLNGYFTGNGVYRMAENATLEFTRPAFATGVYASGGRVEFTSPGVEKLRVNDYSGFDLSLAGFGLGDRFLFGFLTPVQSASWNAGVLTAEFSNEVRQFNLEGDYSKVTFGVVSEDNLSGVILTPAILDIAPLAASKLEGQAGGTPFTFTVTRTSDTKGSLSATWTVAGVNGSGTVPATAADFAGVAFPTGTVSFTPCETTRTITVNVAGDAAVELNERFGVTLSAPSLATIIGTGSAEGVIFNDDATLAIAATSASKAEGNAGTTALTFTVTRAGYTAVAHSVNWAVAGILDGAALPANAADFAGGALPAGTITFAAGETAKTITVTIAGDLAVETDEAFAVTLSAASAGATIATATATGVIQNEDTNFAIAATSANKPEGHAGTTPFTFTLSRVGKLNLPYSIDWSVIGSCVNQVGAADFGGGVLPSGIVAFAMGEAARTITIDVATDSVAEADEGFTISLGTPPSGTTITIGSANGTILNDDSTLAIAALSASKPEGNGGGSTAFTFSASRTGDLSGTVNAKWTTAGITDSGTLPANAADILGGALPSGTVSFAAGESSKTMTVSVVPDSMVELNERFAVTLAAPSAGASIGAATAQGIIFNDDASLSIATLNASRAEGTGGNTPFTFQVTRGGFTGSAVSATWSVAGVAGSGTVPANAIDFVGGILPTGTVSFAAGQTGQTITIDVAADAIQELNGRFAITLSAPSAGAMISTASAEGIILNDDAVPLLAIAPLAASVPEGKTGTTAFTFQVTRSGATGGTSSATWTGAGSGAASADAKDFAGGVLPRGTVSFAPGETQRTITVAIAADRLVERTETFTVALSAPSSGTTISTATATGTIVNDDVAHDLGGDGRADFLVQTYPDGMITAYSHNAAHALNQAATIGSWGSYWFPIDIADADANGTRDIFLYSQASEIIA